MQVLNLDDPIRLLKAAHGLNPKAKIHFVIRQAGDQMEIVPASVSKAGRNPDEMEIHGESTDDFKRLLTTMAFYQAAPVELSLLTNRRVTTETGLSRAAIKLPTSEVPWQTDNLKAVLPFITPETVEWSIKVYVGEPGSPEIASIWVTSTEARKLLTAHPSSAKNLEAARFHQTTFNQKNQIP